MVAAPESEVARLERQLKALEDEVAMVAAAAVRETELLEAGLRGDRWRGWTAVGAALGLLVAAAMVSSVESLFTRPQWDPECRIPMPRWRSMQQFDRAFPPPRQEQADP